MQPTYVCFYTTGTIYETEAARLRRSLDRLGLKHDLWPIEDRGSWARNAGFTATFLLRSLQIREGPVVYLDADAIVWSTPTLFESLSPSEYDLAAHYRGDRELLNGTLWMANTPACRKAIETYKAKCDARPDHRNEQIFLQETVREMGDAIRLRKLPASYCFIHDLMADDLVDGEQPVIEHMQASRETSKSTLLPNRRRRLAEIEGLI